MSRFLVTARHGPRNARYHTLEVDADDMAAALREAAARLPEPVRASADLVEIRIAPDPAARP